MDEFEKYIQDQRDELDIEQPNTEIWRRVRDEVHQKPKTKVIEWKHVWRAAAVFVLLASTAYWIADPSINPNQTVATIENFQLDTSESEFVEMETFYARQISEQKLNLSKLIGMNTNIMDKINEEEKELTTEYEDLKQLLNRDINNQKIIDAMVMNLQLRMKLFQKQLDMMNQLQIRKTKQNEDIKI